VVLATSLLCVLGLGVGLGVGLKRHHSSSSSGGGSNTYGVCTGTSSSLTTAQCNAWQDLYHATGGSAWNYCNSSSYLLDPCSCSYDSNIGAGVKCSPCCIRGLGLPGIGLIIIIIIMAHL
jgi:hypothetical protein